MKKIFIFLTIGFIFVLLLFQHNALTKTIYAIIDADGNIVGATDLYFMSKEMIEDGYSLEYLFGVKKEKYYTQQVNYNTYGSVQEPTFSGSGVEKETDTIQIIKRNAKVKWGNDEKMYQYEVEKQTSAYNWYKSENQYPDILKKAKSKWEDETILWSNMNMKN